MSQGTQDQYKSEVEKIWEQYDLDGSGTLDKQEAFTFLREFIGDLTGNVPGEQELEDQFFNLDEDESGEITKEEAVRYLRGYRAGHQLKLIMGGSINKIGMM